jgi:hypothetical protein
MQFFGCTNYGEGLDVTRTLKLLFLAFLFLVSLVNALHAQQYSCLIRSIPVNVLTPDGNFLDGLSPQSFWGKMRGGQVEIQSASRDSGPRRIVMVLDASGSMDHERNFEVHMVKTFLNVDHDSSIALIIFSGGVDDTVDFSHGRTGIPSELARFKNPPKGQGVRKTALRDAIGAALNLLHPAQFGDAIYLISDGEENASKLNDSQTENELIRAGVRLFALVPMDAPGGSADELRRMRPDWVLRIVAATGGDSLFFNLSDFLLGLHPEHPEAKPATTMGQQLMQYATRGFAHEIATPYRLTLKLPEPLSKPRDWDLSVLDSKGKPNEVLRIRYPQRFAPCP